MTDDRSPVPDHRRPTTDDGRLNSTVIGERSSVIER
jgi:hypothetical protein